MKCGIPGGGIGGGIIDDWGGIGGPGIPTKVTRDRKFWSNSC